MNLYGNVADYDGLIFEEGVDSPDHYHCRLNQDACSFLCFDDLFRLHCLPSDKLANRMVKDAGVENVCS